MYLLKFVNLYLFKFNILNSSSCTSNKNYIETIEHIVYDCILVEELWLKIEEWMLNEFDISLCFDKISVLFEKNKNIDIYILQNSLILLSNSTFFHLNTGKRQLHLVLWLSGENDKREVLYRKISTTERF